MLSSSLPVTSSGKGFWGRFQGLRFRFCRDFGYFGIVIDLGAIFSWLMNQQKTKVV
jgi:hypothetical protein